MRHFPQFDAARDAALFHRPPGEFGRDSDAGTLAVALGATLYSPATRPRLAADVAKRARLGVRSMVLCLEDSIADGDVGAGEANLVAQLRALDPADAPLLFVRVRTPEQIPDLTRRLGPAAGLLSGFVLPKFGAVVGKLYLDALDEAAGIAGTRMLAMPVIETRDVLHRETRTAALTDLARLLGEHRERVLAVRLGGTDLCAAYGLRRPRDLTIYDVRPVADLISDVVNVFGRADGTGHVVTGTVWEYFTGGLDGLVREIALDKANGITGKTVIHPGQVAAVHAHLVVTHEEYRDAVDVLGVPAGGAMASGYGNKMNEPKPHRTWAERVLRRAGVFGVAAPHVEHADVLAAAGGAVPR